MTKSWQQWKWRTMLKRSCHRCWTEPGSWRPRLNNLWSPWTDMIWTWLTAMRGSRWMLLRGFVDWWARLLGRKFCWIFFSHNIWELASGLGREILKTERKYNLLRKIAIILCCIIVLDCNQSQAGNGYQAGSWGGWGDGAGWVTDCHHGFNCWILQRTRLGNCLFGLCWEDTD